jgi:hypothetical protein
MMNFMNSICRIFFGGDEIKENEKGRACGRHGGERKCLHGFGGEACWKENQLEDTGIDGKIKWMLRKWAGRAQTGVIWLKRGDK